MTVKELINELLDCPMGADVYALVEISKDDIQECLMESGEYSYPIDDDVPTKEVFQVDNQRVRIYLEDLRR